MDARMEGFNSIVVRLKDLNDLRFKVTMQCFNSIVVRLKGVQATNV